MSKNGKLDKEGYTNALFDMLWDGKRIWDALVSMQEKRHVSPDKVLNCRRKSTRWNELKYEMEWKPAGLKVVLRGNVRPIMGIWEWLFGDAETRCYNKAVKWLDAACEEEQNLLFDVVFLAGDTPVQGADRNRKLTQEFVKYLNSIEPEVSQTEANRKADAIINKEISR